MVSRCLYCLLMIFETHVTSVSFRNRSKMADVTTAGLLGNLANFVGTTEPALRLLLSIFLGYPLALIHRKFLYGQKGSVQHLYFILTGIAIGYFNYGCDFIHCLVAIVYTYLITTLLKGSLLSLQISFALNFAHLLFGYWATETDDYDIKWTMPHCVLVLRLIGYAFNIYDGTQPENQLSSENKKVCLRKPPDFIKYCGFMCFPASILVGPQFPYKRYEDFVGGKFRDSKNETDLPNCITPSLKRLGCGILYLSIFQIGNMIVPDSYILSDDFLALSFVKKMVNLAVWGRCALYKYISCWLISEGALIMFSLSHNGKNATGETQWNGCENVKLLLFENTTEFNHYIQSFNINTNQWSAQYIYKRLKFLGNRYLSQLMTLLFLAIWHGFHTGYYMTFFMEFIVMYFEKDLAATLSKHEHIQKFLSQGPVQIVLHILRRLYTFLFMGYCMAPFVFLQFDKYWRVYSAVYYIGFIFFLPWAFLYKPILKACLGKPKKSSENIEKLD